MLEETIDSGEGSVDGSAEDVVMDALRRLGWTGSWVKEGRRKSSMGLWMRKMGRALERVQLSDCI